MTLAGGFVRARLVVAVAALLIVVAAAMAHSRSASAGPPCNSHYAAPVTCSILGTLRVACSGAHLRYALSTSSAIHGYPPVGGYYRYTGYAVGQYVDGSGYCLGTSSNAWVLTDSGWITRALAYVTS